MLTGLGLAALPWAAQRRREHRAAPIVDTVARVLIVASFGGEVALAPYARLSGQQRSNLTGKVWTTALAAASGDGDVLWVVSDTAQEIMILS